MILSDLSKIPAHCCRFLRGAPWLQPAVASSPGRRLLGKINANVVRHVLLSANQRKVSAENVTGLPTVISLLTCEWRALRQLELIKAASSHTWW